MTSEIFEGDANQNIVLFFNNYIARITILLNLQFQTLHPEKINAYPL